MDKRSIIRDILIEEGGFWKDPVGGPTNYGITQNTLNSIRHLYSGLPDLVNDLTEEEAAYIIDKEFISKQRVDQLPAPLDVLMGHMVVMSWDDGARILQSYLGLKEDGIIGSQTLQAVHAVNPLSIYGLSWRLTNEFIATRTNGYQRSYTNRFNSVIKRVLA
jgi:lysozyme family protein